MSHPETLAKVLLETGRLEEALTGKGPLPEFDWQHAAIVLRRQVVRIQGENAAWRECARRLEIFAVAYRLYPKRNPDDKLDEVLRLYELLKGKS